MKSVGFVTRASRILSPTAYTHQNVNTNQIELHYQVLHYVAEVCSCIRSRPAQQMPANHAITDSRHQQCLWEACLTLIQVWAPCWLHDIIDGIATPDTRFAVHVEIPLVKARLPTDSGLPPKMVRRQGP